MDRLAPVENKYVHYVSAILLMYYICHLVLSSVAASSVAISKNRMIRFLLGWHSIVDTEQ